MTTPVSNSGFIPNYDAFLQNPGLPKTQLPSFDSNSILELIGVGDLTMLSVFGNQDTRAQWEQEYQSILAKGDGNAAVDHIIKGLKDGTISKEEAIGLAKQVQEEANANGGGRINGEKRDALKEALGTDVDHISKGKTRAQIGWEKFLDGLLKFFGL